MYSIFLPFACLILDLATAYVHLTNLFWWSGIATALIALVPLVATASLLYCGISRIQQATILFGFLHSGPQLILQLTLLVRYWNFLEVVLISYGTLDSPVYIIVVITCVSGSLVLAKSARECHFLSQAPAKPLRITASYFRASPFFLLHVLFRGLSLGLIISLTPNWVGLLLVVLVVLSNLLQLKLLLNLPYMQVLVSSLTSVLTPAVFPGRYPLSIQKIARFQIINSVSTSVLIFIGAVVSQVLFGLAMCDAPPLADLLITETSSTTEVGVIPLTRQCFEHWALQFGFLPYIILGGCFYMALIIIVAGIIRPSWLTLPKHIDSAQSTLGRISEEEGDPTIQLEKNNLLLPTFQTFVKVPETDI